MEFSLLLTLYRTVTSLPGEVKTYVWIQYSHVNILCILYRYFDVIISNGMFYFIANL